MTKAQVSLYAALAVVTSFAWAIALLCFFYAVGPWLDPKAIPFFGKACEPIIFGSAGSAILLASAYLLIGRKWAWWVATTLSSILALAGCIALLAFFHPRDDFARAETGGYLFFLGLLFLIVGAILVLLLLLPPVRQRFSQAAPHELPTEHPR